VKVEQVLFKLLACRESEAVLCLSEFKQLEKDGVQRAHWFVQPNPILAGLFRKSRIPP
jgi:hypothetical protein